MVVESIQVRSFRNLLSVDLEPSPGLNVLHGANGQGKTAFLEAVHFLAEGRTFRGVRASSLVRIGDSALSVRGRVLGPHDLREDLQSAWSRQGRKLRRNGDEVRGLSDYWGALRVVVHSPEDGNLISGPPEGRRKFLNRILALTRPALYRTLVDFTRVVRNRNHCLRAGRPVAEIDAWTEPFLRMGTAIRVERTRLVSDLVPRVAERYRALSDREDLEVELRYRSSGGVIPHHEETDAARERLEAELERTRDRERDWGRTVTGPHLDELDVRLRSGPARSHASQGERRTLLIALRFAERELVAAATGEDPVFLVDDLSSELDRDRTHRVLGAVRDIGGQVFLTGTEDRDLDGEVRRFEVRAGAITATGPSLHSTAGTVAPAAGLST